MEGYNEWLTEKLKQDGPVEHIEKRNLAKQVMAKPKKRISREQMFMDIAYIVAQRGTCDRANVGAVLVNPKNIIVSIGYNGSPSGEPHCDEAGHVMYEGHCIRTVHAEQNCIDKMDFLPSGEYTLYVTHYPCMKCQIALYEKLRKNPGATMTVFYDVYRGDRTSFEKMKEVKEILQFKQKEYPK